jgi:hypothetical protein
MTLRVGVGMAAFSLVVAACGGGSHSASSVQSCLAGSGFAVTRVPASEIAPNASENRGPGQTGELLVGPPGAAPQIGGSGLAVVAYWDSTAHAQQQVRSVRSAHLGIIEAFGTTTIQGDKASPAQLKRITACVK